MQRNLKAVNFLVKAYLRSQKEKRQLYLRYTFCAVVAPHIHYIFSITNVQWGTGLCQYIFW